MALPFIVGPHQCSLTQGPDGRPQVEVVLRIRLPLAEFFDALLLTLAEQHLLFPQGGHEPDPASIAPVKVGLQATERRSPSIRRRLRLSGKQLVVHNPRSLLILPRRLHC